MKLNDPFGRVGRRDQAKYETIKQQLQSAGIDSTGALTTAQRNINRSVLTLLAVVIGMAALFALLAPATRGIVGTFGALILLWISANYVQTRLHLRRYRRELETSGASHETITDGGNHR